MQDSVASIVKQHYKLGYTSALLAVDILLVALFLFDIGQFLALGYSLRAAVMSTRWSDISGSIDNLIAVWFVLLVVLPLVIAFIRLYAPLRLSSAIEFRNSLTTTILHAGCCVAVVPLLIFTLHMQSASGYRIQAGTDARFAFGSLFAAVMQSNRLRTVLGVFSTGALALGSALIGYLVLPAQREDKGRRIVQQHKIRLALADLPAELVPVSSRLGASGSSRPELVHRIKVDALERYESLWRHDSARAIAYLDGLYQESVAYVQTTVGNVAGPGLRVGLLQGLRRAFECALGQTSSSARPILVSPHLSPSFRQFLRWYGQVTSRSVTFVEFSAADHLKPWREQEATLLDHITKQAQAGPFTFIASEVFYATGLRLPLGPFLTRVRQVAPDPAVYILVDGSNAVGNGRASEAAALIDGAARWDSYVFTPNRWLLAPSRCGVLVTRSPEALDACGLYTPGVSHSETEVHAVTGLYAALMTMKKYQPEFFFDRCADLIEHFILNLDPNVQRIGEKMDLTPTCVLAFRPSEHGWRWESPDLDKKLRAYNNAIGFGEQASASFVELEPSTPWLRVPVTYYTDLRAINQLNAFLTANTY